MPTKRSAALASLALLAGCTDDGGAMGVDSTWGEANRQTFAAQVIDPNPQYDTEVPVSTGTQAAAAIERVRTDKVKKPERIKTTSGVSGSSAGQ